MIPSRFRRTPFIARMATRLSFLAAGCADAADPPSAGDRASDSSEINAGAADGRLRRVLGRRGDGPGEFRLPVSARRTLDGSVAVVDFMAGRFAFFPPAGGEGAAAQMVDSPVQGIMDIRHLEGDRYLLAGLDRTGDPGRFQVFGVFLLAEGDIAIQSMQARERDPVWDLLIVGRSGAAEWKARNLPRLYAVESVRPNRRVVARRRAAQ